MAQGRCVRARSLPSFSVLDLLLSPPAREWKRMEACVPSGGRRGRTQVEAGVASREEGVAASGIGRVGANRSRMKEQASRNNVFARMGKSQEKLLYPGCPKVMLSSFSVSAWSHENSNTMRVSI